MTGETIIVKRFKISRPKFNLIVKCFSVDITASSSSQILGLNRNTLNRYYTFLRRLVVKDQQEKRLNFLVDKTAEVDESYFGPTRVRGKRGRGASRKIIVIGILKRKEGVYAKVLDNCSTAEILPILLEKIREGSEIYTDGWRSYDALAVYGYSHKKIAHGENEFARSEDYHINGIESFWSFTKRRLAKFNGIRRADFLFHLYESEWRFNERGRIEEKIRKLVKDYRHSLSSFRID